MRVLAYIRVSSVHGRGGESFISPAEQRKAIEALAIREGFTIVDWLEELDASGGDETRPKWNEAIAMVERGEADGIAVWNLSRFSRNIVHARQAIERLESAGGKLYSASETADGITRDMLFLMAEYQRNQAREGFETASRNAVERGVWCAPTPFGYDKDSDKRLVPNNDAPMVREIFERRAGGTSITELQELSGLSRSTIGALLSNRVYLGEVSARGGRYVNTNAHTALVSTELFDRVQAARGVRPVKTGKTDAMLKSLVRCASCGSTMLVQPATSKSHAAYYCSGRTKAACPKGKRAYARVAELDTLMDEFVLSAFETGPLVEAVASTERVSECAQVLADAEHELGSIMSSTRLVSTLGIARFETMIEQAQKVVDLAKADYLEAKAASEAVGDFEGSMLKEWPTLSCSDKREILHGFIDAVEIRRGRGDLRSRVRIIGRGNVILEPQNEVGVPSALEG